MPRIDRRLPQTVLWGQLLRTYTDKGGKEFPVGYGPYNAVCVTCGAEKGYWCHSKESGTIPAGDKRICESRLRVWEACGSRWDQEWEPELLMLKMIEATLE